MRLFLLVILVAVIIFTAKVLDPGPQCSEKDNKDPWLYCPVPEMTRQFK